MASAANKTEKLLRPYIKLLCVVWNAVIYGAIDKILPIPMYLSKRGPVSCMCNKESRRFIRDDTPNLSFAAPPPCRLPIKMR